MQSGVSRTGSAMITCVIFLVIFTALAIGLATISGANLQVADNQQEANRAFASAESGLDVLRYWLNRVKLPSSTPAAQYLSATISAVQNDLQTSGVSSLVVANDGAIAPVTLNGVTGQTFSGQIAADPGNPNVLQLRIRGASGTAVRTIQVQFSIEPYRFPIFNYGIATKGALRFPQNPTLTGAASNWEADIYVESSNDLTALQVGGNTNFDGDIDIANPLANVDFQGNVQIAGDTGQAAIDNHVEVGVEPVDFPVPDTARFAGYATGGAIDPNSTSAPGVTLVNAVIPAGMDPTFGGNVTIQGILFIEQPNVVTFTKNVQLDGLIVADGDATNPGTNAISFQGNFASSTYPLGSEFDALRSVLLRQPQDKVLVQDVDHAFGASPLATLLSRGQVGDHLDDGRLHRTRTILRAAARDRHHQIRGHIIRVEQMRQRILKLFPELLPAVRSAHGPKMTARCP